jgi:Fe-S oxidoreductase
VPLLVGCAYLRYSPAEARAVVRVAEWLVRGPVRLVRSCCGLPWLEAGDRASFTRSARALAEELRGAGRLLVVDPGCARTLLEEYPRVGVELGPIDLLVDRLAADLERLPARAIEGAPLRIHDSCQLARALGRDALPRLVLERLTGAPPGELVRARRAVECCGAGGLLPLTRPSTSRAIAEERIREHRELGPGPLVTTCGGSLHRFRRSGEPAIDWLELVARALGLVGEASTNRVGG